MSTLTGTMHLARLNVRRDRVRLAVWLAALTGLLAATTAGIKSLYPTAADLAGYAETAGSSPAATALNGPGHAVDTAGGATVFEVGGYLSVAVALMSVLIIGRCTRAEEESGRLELLRANVLGRHAALAAAVIVMVAMNIAVGTAVAAIMTAFDVSAAGAATFGAALAGIGIVFGAVAAVTSQITEHVRGSNAIAGTVVAAAYVIRAAGDVGETGLSWLSPFGWVQATRPFADERWWPLLIALGAAALLVAMAVALQNRRDVGAGLVPQRPGPASASPTLLHQVGFSLRLQRASLIGWTVGVFLGGLAFGSVAREMEDIVAESDDLQEWVSAYGANPTEAFLALTLLLLSLAAAGCAIASALRITSEESAGRAEPILATPLSRPAWLLSHLVAPLAAAIVVPVAGGLGTGIAYGILTSDAEQIPRLAGAAMAHVPAVWLLTAATVLLIGLLPRLAVTAWAILAGCVVAAMLGSLIRLPDWVLELSPFEHTPRLPGGSMDVAASLTLTGLAAAVIVVGVVSFRRRDVR
ncbi:hypothetical protein [Haloactinopolyspora sp.]|uniref:ABC transporter permease n=1 Tax=Haloactinopolyspora sp. TaxID=1966353 RepID=UPI00260BC854|nr:hypothetical protein [Haloactinopolyspora sp.]